MFSQFLKRMDDYQGDLTDILRASCSTPAPDDGAAARNEWQFPSNPMNYSTWPDDDFGHPFTHLRDPLLDFETPISGFFHNIDIIKDSIDETGCFATGGGNNSCSMSLGHKIIDNHDQMKIPTNIFSRMLQISPTTKLPLSPCNSPAAAAPPRGMKGPPILVSNDQSSISLNNSKSCWESPGLRISSPRITGIKRRKCQAKKVVCIPAPAATNSRSTGEVVPSDLWAWRKYGQKPIKGSPYPRGYYRCSSSKGCSARKQVERSRTDPNMLVITYTSEHNHPWPTQRNALAGSTRSQPSKTTTASKDSPNSQSQKPAIPKEEQKEVCTETTNSAAMKEDPMDQEIDDTDFDEGFLQSYKPTSPKDNFFAGLGETDSDSLDMLLFDGRDNKALDPFSFYGWAGSNTAAPASGGGAGYGGGKRES